MRRLACQHPTPGQGSCEDLEYRGLVQVVAKGLFARLVPE